MLRSTVLFALLACTLARESPHAGLIRKLAGSPNERLGRYSNNVVEDALLDVPDLVRKYGYPLEVHTVVTQDGYILDLHRIPHGRGQTPGSRPVVFVNHGMFGSSADWVVAGPGKGLGYILADAGYDVWLGNARGTYYSRRHILLNPDSQENLSFWQFSWEEIGNFDLPASVDRALSSSGQQRLHFIAHSQGGTSYFVMTTMRPEYNSRIISFHGMAPAVFNTAEIRPTLQMVAPYLSIAEVILAEMGIAEMFPNSDRITEIALDNCMDGQLSQLICSQAFHAFGGYSPEMHNATILPIILGHTPAGASFRQLAHFSQLMISGEFRRYDYGLIQNLLTYGRTTPPDYNLALSTARVFIYYGDNDNSVSSIDLQTLHSVLPNSVGIFRVELDTFNHVDFLYGSGAKELVYDRIIDIMRSLDREDV